jgi:hypothetical protein
LNVSAAHCVQTKKPNDFVVILGMHRLEEMHDVSQYQNVQERVVSLSLHFSRIYLKKLSFQPSQVIPHPEYNQPSRWDNDVALILFADPGFTITDFVRPICL